MGRPGSDHTRWRRTEGRPTATRTRTWQTTTSSPSSTTASSRTSPHCVTSLLADGVVFRSETDTEVAAALLGREYAGNGGDLQLGLPQHREPPRGRVHPAGDAPGPPWPRGRRPSQLPARDRLGEGENFLGSDVAAFIEYTRRRSRSARTRSSRSRRSPSPSWTSPARPSSPSRSTCPGCRRRREGRMVELSWPRRSPSSPRPSPTRSADASTTARSSSPSSDGLDELFVASNRVIITACGTASYAALVGKYAIEQWARVAVDGRTRPRVPLPRPVIGADTLVVSISQSGETMDTLMAVKYARERGARTLSVCNTQGATIPRESDAVVYTHAGTRGRCGPRPRRSPRRSPRSFCWACTWVGCAARSRRLG